MKKQLFLLLSLLTLLSGCQEAEPDAPTDVAFKGDSKEFVFAQNRTVDEAIEIAINAAQSCDHARSRSEVRTVSINNIKAVTKSASRSGGVDSLLYVVNFDDDQGFVLVPIPRTTKEVLAIVDNGSYDPAVGTDNPGFNLYLEAASDYIDNQVNIGNIRSYAGLDFELTPRLEYKSQVDTIAQYGNYHWLGELAWGQQIPYNKYTPNGYTGCAPTAMAMMIAALIPANTRLVYTFPERDIDSEDVNWIYLRDHKKNNPYYLEYEHICYAENPDKNHKSIARFMRQIGLISKSEYGMDGSGTATRSSKFLPTLKYFLPDKFLTEEKTYKSDQVMGYLDWGYLLMWANSRQGGAHAWLGEGYHFLKTRHRIWERTKGELIWKLTDDYIKTLSVTYFNWGWDGSYNGFYDGVVLEPTSGYTYYDPKYIAGTYIER